MNLTMFKHQYRMKSDIFIDFSEISVDYYPFINENGIFMYFYNTKNVSK